jgi:hypothetical protein
MALKIETKIENPIRPHDISDYCAFLDSDDDFYIIDNNAENIVQLDWSGCVVFPISIEIETIEQFLRHQFGENTLLKRAYRTGEDYSITVEAN